MYQDSPGWVLYSHVAFIVSLAMMLVGVWALDVDLAIKGYFTMGVFFLTGSAFTLAKTLRDRHEARRRSGAGEQLQQ